MKLFYDLIIPRNYFFTPSIMSNKMKTCYWIFMPIVFASCSASKDWTIKDTDIISGLHDIEIINDKTAVAYSYGSGEIYKTTNGGKHWDMTYQFDSIYFEQIRFLDDRNGWIVGSPNKIYKTEDGGNTWLNRSLKEESTESYIYGMYFNDPNNGYISALERKGKGFVTTIFQTKDGGETWTQANQVDEMILNLEKTNGTLYGTGNNVIIKNIEDPDNLDYIFQNDKVGQIRDMAQRGDKIYAVSFNGYFIEINGEVQQTKIITENRLRSLASINEQTWIAVGDTNNGPGNLFTSHDNGTNWTVSEKEFPDLHRVEKSGKKLWAVGKQGLVMLKRK